MGPVHRISAWPALAVLIVLGGAVLPSVASATPGAVRHGVQSRALTAAQRSPAAWTPPRRWVLGVPPAGHRAIPRAWRHSAARVRRAAHAGGVSRLAATENRPGLSHTTFGAGDVTGAIGPDRYVEATVDEVGIYDRRDLSEIATAPLTELMGASSDNQAGTPQIQWDGTARHWLYSMVDFAPDGLFLAFGWSKTADPSDPRRGWCHHFLTLDESDTNDYRFEDTPVLGHGNGLMLLASDQYDEADELLTARVRAITEPDAGDASCQVPPITAFGSADKPLRTADGDLASGLVPAATSDSGGRSYVVAADAAGSDGERGGQIMAWHIGGPPDVPTLIPDGNMGVASYGPPDPVELPMDSRLLLSPPRLLQAVAHTDPDAGGSEAVWTQHTVAGADGQTEVRWYELVPSGLTVRQHGTVSASGAAVFAGAISPASDGTSAAIQYDVAGPQLLPEIRARSRVSDTPLGEMAQEQVLGVSAAPNNCTGACSWNFAGAASPDPADDGAVWGSNALMGEPPPDGFLNEATRNFALDTAPRTDATPPQTTIEEAPSGNGNGPNASVDFSADDPAATFECQFDHAGWHACTSPDAATGLMTGPHTFDVRATDAAGNTDPTPARASWFVGFPPANDDFADAQVVPAVNGPVTVQGSNVGATREDGEPDHFGYAAGHSVWYRWTAARTGTVALSTCGSNRFTVMGVYTGRAVDDLAEVASVGVGSDGCPGADSALSFRAVAGTTYSVAVDGVSLFPDAAEGRVTFTVDPPVPPDTTITAGPAAGARIADPTPTFSFSAAPSGAHFACRSDGSPWTTCSSPATLRPLGDGAHTFAVRAVDADGNADPTPARRSFTVDTTGPVAAITAGPADGARITDATPTFSFRSPEAGARLACSVDGAAYTVCSSPTTLSPLSGGLHTFAVRASDALGNAGLDFRTFTVDRSHALAREERRRLLHRRVHFHHGVLSLGAVKRGQLPRSTVIRLSLHAHEHVLGRRKITIRRAETATISLRVGHRRHPVHATLSLTIKIPHHGAVKGRRSVRLRRR